MDFPVSIVFLLLWSSGLRGVVSGTWGLRVCAWVLCCAPAKREGAEVFWGVVGRLGASRIDSGGFS